MWLPTKVQLAVSLVLRVSEDVKLYSPLTVELLLAGDSYQEHLSISINKTRVLINRVVTAACLVPPSA